MRDWRSGGMSVPFGTFHHLERQSRQQQAQACCALNTGCPRIGVCLPSLGGFAGARRVRMKSSQWHTRRLSGVATHREATAPKRKRGRADRLDAFVRDVLPVRFRKAEPAEELGLGKFLEGSVNSVHLTTISSSRCHLRTKWFLRDAMTPWAARRLISAESALRSTQRKSASCWRSNGMSNSLFPHLSANERR